ncbi:MAG: EAL domain-containing protein [Pseudomonadales bacterium]|nr:EAL domain-containing protein [Pseudomonadales bacterium]
MSASPIALNYPTAFWRKIVEQLPYSVYVGDLERQCLIYTNQENCHAKFSHHDGTLPFKDWFGFFSQDEIFLLKKDIERVCQGTSEKTIERIFKMRCEDFEWGYYHHTISMVEREIDLPGKGLQSSKIFIGIVREVSDAFYQGRELRDSEERYRLLANNSNDLIWTTDCDFNITYISPAVESFTGYSFEELLFSKEPKIFSKKTNRLIRSIYVNEFCLEELKNANACGLQNYVRLEQPLYHKDGETITVEIQLSLLFNDFGIVTGTLGVARDVTDRKKVEGEMRLAATVFESCREAVFITDQDGVMLRANGAFYNYTGVCEADVVDKHFSSFWDVLEPELFLDSVQAEIDVNQNWRGECNYIGKDGKRPCLLSFSASLDELGRVSHYVGIFLDIFEKKQDELRIERLAYYDALTQVANRSLFSDRLSKAIQQAERRKMSVAVLFLDLDRFKPVNDSLGHSAGDSLLQGVARRLQYCVREEDTVARMGGDEFAIILAGLNRGEDAERIVLRTANRIISQFVSPFLIEGREVYTSTSVGVAVYPRDGLGADELLRNADMAMYEAKKSGRNNYQFYDSKMNAKAMERLFIENALRRALLNSEFLFYFQPYYEVGDHSVAGVELLLRWQHPQFGLLEPQQFIGLAEETDLIIPIGEWVFEHACKLMASWGKQGIKLSAVSVNVSPSQFKRKNFVEWALLQVERYQIDPSQIVMEITESALMADVDHSLSVLSELKSAGIRIAVDDFGTGYSSLSYLRKFPIDILKIDREFVKDIIDEPDELPLIHGVISIAKSLRLKVIAEGVETREQFDFLSTHGCDAVQGHYFSKAVSETRFREVLAESKMAVSQEN